MVRALSTFVCVCFMSAAAACASSGGGAVHGVGSSGDSGTTTHDAGPTKVDDAGHPTGEDGGAHSGEDSGGATPADESEWLAQMNAARSAVGEKALTWDPIAAKVALAYANMCDFEHNEDRDDQYSALGGDDAGLGENIAAGTDETVAEAVANWISEESSYDHANNSCALLKECGHYTQIVWSTTTEVGCAQVTCTTGSPFGSGSWLFSVCDFNPPGNFDGEAPY